MHVHKYERIWIIIGTITMLTFFTTVAALGIAGGMNPPSHQESIDPAKVRTTPPFDHPGLRKVGDNAYEAYYIGQVFSWEPAELTIPRGAKVTFYVTSTDVVHGFTIPEEDVNVEVMPGWVSTATHTFQKAGTYLLLCNQYCGIGHHTMSARIIVK